MDFENQYRSSLERILKYGVEVENRTGINTLSVQHQYFHLQNILNSFPRIKGKMVYPKMALKEVLWMMYGRNDVKWLNEHGVNYWNAWAQKDGTIGKTYGYQFRNFNGVDQLEILLMGMRMNPLGRRHILNLWNVKDLDEMGLPPCMYDFHFSCVPHFKNEKKRIEPIMIDYFDVDLHVRVRSNDSFIGTPYDFMFAAWFLILVCMYLSNSLSMNFYYKPRDIHYTADDYHLYVNHIEQAKQYIENVKKNENNLIRSRTKFTPQTKSFLKWFMEKICVSSVIDNYLYWVECDIANINLANYNNNKLNTSKSPIIKADVAV